MNIENYNIVDLLEVLYRAMTGVSKKVFTTNRPSSTDESMDDFIVVSFPTSIIPNGVYGYTTCRISLYARDNSNGENLPLLRDLQNKAYERLPINHERCSIYEPTPINAGSDKLGFHCMQIQCKVKIKQKL